jgi:hypothetical protein
MPAVRARRPRIGSPLDRVPCTVHPPANFDRANRIGGFWGYPESRAFAELLIDCEEDRTRRAVLVGMLREGDH